MGTVLITLALLGQPPAKKEAVKDQPPPRPSVARLWPRLKDVPAAQREQLKKLTDEYAAQIAELEAERDQRLTALLTKSQRDALAALAADDIDRYRVVLQARPARPAMAAKVVRDNLGLEQGEAMNRLNAGPGKPIAENLTRAKAEALVKALGAQGTRAVMEKQEPPRQ